MNKKSPKKNSPAAGAKGNPAKAKDEKSVKPKKDTLPQDEAPIVELYPEGKLPAEGADLEDALPECLGEMERPVHELCMSIAEASILGEPPGMRQELAPVFQMLKAAGIDIECPVHRLLDGVRDLETLTQGITNPQVIEITKGLLDAVQSTQEFYRRRSEFLLTFPKSLREACDSGDSDDSDDSGEDAFEAAFEALPPEEQERFRDGLAELHEEFDIYPEDDDEEEESLGLFIDDIVDVALGNPSPELRSELEEEVLAVFGEDHPFSRIVHRIWDGERDDEALTGELEDQNTAGLVREILDRIRDEEEEEGE